MMFRLFFGALPEIAAAIDRLARVSGMGVLIAFWLLLCDVSPLLGIGLAVAVAYQHCKGAARPNDTFGTARWASTGDLQRAGCLFRRDCLLLGKAAARGGTHLLQAFFLLLTFPLWQSREALALVDRASKYPLVVYVSDRTVPHAVVFGASGSGKSACFAIPNLLHWPHGLICLDPKGELFRKTARARARQFGQEIVCIDPYGVTGAAYRAQFNPLDLNRDDERTRADEALRLANALIVRTGEEKEPFWNESSAVLIQAIITFLMSVAKPEEANLNRLRDILTTPKVMEELLDYLRRSDACFGLLRRMAGQIDFFQGQTKASIYAVANSHLSFLDSAPVAETLHSTSFDPRKLLDDQMTVYLCLPVDRIYETTSLQRIILTSLINMIFQAGEDPARRILLLLDEAATLGDFDALYSSVVYGRSFGLRLMLLFQSVRQVELCFPESKAHDFRATVASTFCGINDLHTATEVSQWIGQTTVANVSEQTSRSWGQSRSNAIHDMSVGTNFNQSHSSTLAYTGRALIQPEEVLQLPPWAAITLLPGIPPILLRKVPYFAKRRGLWTLIRQSCDTLVSAVIAAVCTTLLACLLWTVTIGRDHPKVQEIVEDYCAWKASLTANR